MNLVHYSNEFILCILDVILLYRFSALYLKSKNLTTKRYVTYSVLAALFAFGLSFMTDYSTPVTLLLLVSIVVYVHMAFDAKFNLNVIVSLAYYLILGIITTIVISLAVIVLGWQVESMFENPLIRTTIALTIKVIFFMLIEFFRIVRKDKRTSVSFMSGSLKYFFVLTFLTLLILFESMIVDLDEYRPYFVQYMALVFGVFFVFIIYILLRNAKNREELLATENMLEESKIRQEGFIREADHHLSVLRTKHDLKNYMIALRHLVEHDSKEASLAYLDEMKLLDAFQTYVHTPNEVVNAILNAKISACPDIDIRVRTEIESFDFKAHHLSIIFGNSLDNAIEAVGRMSNTKKYIKVVISENSQYGKIVIENPYEGVIEEKQGGIFSSKRVNSLGIGLLSLRNVVEDMGGEMKHEYGQGIFILTLLLKKA